MKIAGRTDALSIIDGALYIVCFGSGDILLNYYINPLLRLVYTPDQFTDILAQNYADFIQVYTCISKPMLFIKECNSYMQIIYMF